MARIYIASVNYDESTYTVLIALTEVQTVDGKDIDCPIGEATVKIPTDMEMEDARKAIIKAAQDIKKAHDNAVDKKKDLKELQFPEINGT